LDEIEQNFPRDFLQMIHEKQKILGDIELIEKDLRKKSFEGQKLKRFGDLQHQIELISSNIGEGKGSIEKINSDITSNSEFIKKIEKELDALYLAYEKSSKKAKFLKEIANISNLLNDYIDKLRAAKINQLEDSTFLMFKKLLGKGESINNLSIDPKTYLITVVNNSGDIVRKESLSAGEKEIFAISLLWGLARTSQLKLPIIIDTPLSRLDSHHRDKIVGEYFPNAGHQVIILSTDTEVDKKYYDILENHLQHAIRLKYDGSEKITTIEDGYFWRS
jgi:DNA sulfur modification protein DndD